MKAKLELPALRENFTRATDFVGDLLEKNDCDIKLRLLMETIVEEIFVNIASYAYSDAQGDAVIEFSCENDLVQITFTDKGIPFDPLAHDDPDIDIPMEERNIGGLGILMVKQLMDKVIYSRENGCNILNIHKQIK